MSNDHISENKGWRVTFAGMGINLALGILYTWSVISKGIPDEWGWSEAEKSWPYAIACLIFCLVMVPAGRLQDKIAPWIVSTIGGLMVGIGFIITSFTISSIGYIIGFGVLAGAGIGFAYASATPPAVKWFPASKTGLIAGVVVSGFGLASVYAAPLAKWLTVTYGIQNMLLTLGIAFMIIVTVLSQLLKPPPEDYIPLEHKKEKTGSPAGEKAKTAKVIDFSPREMLKTIQFYKIWFMYACGAGAGLMVIAKLAAIAKAQAQLELGFVLVAALALGNGAGRILAGTFSDKMGRQLTMFICFISQAVLVLLLSRASGGNILGNVIALSLISAFIGANYGANLSLFPSITKDFYGLKNFGVNYGLVFTAWGVGGFMLALLAGRLYDLHQTFVYAYYGAAILLAAAAVMTFFSKEPPVNRTGASGGQPDLIFHQN